LAWLAFLLSLFLAPTLYAMPILTKTTHPRKRRTPVWLLVLALVVLSLGTVVTWSCFKPVSLVYQGRGVGFGWAADARIGYPLRRRSGYAWANVGGSPRRGFQAARRAEDRLVWGCLDLVLSRFASLLLLVPQSPTMPILTKTTHPRQRHTPWWPLLLAVVVLVPVGVFGWSCYQPITLVWAEHEVGFGYGNAAGQAFIASTQRAPRHPAGYIPMGVRQWVAPRGSGLSFYRIWWY